MLTQLCKLTQLIILMIVALHVIFVMGVKRDNKTNLTLDKQSVDNKERDGRQFSQGYGPGFSDYGGLSSFGGPLESILIGLCVVAALGIVGIPFFLLFISLFNGGGGGLTGTGLGGLNLVPTTTTTVAGRKRRDITSLLPEVNPLIQQQLHNIFNTFVKNPDKIALIEQIFDSVVGRK